jgi:Sec-independent protein secretion pathway component TatC
MTDFTFPLMTVLATGNAAIDEPFNFFFSLMVAMGLLFLIPWVCFRILNHLN